VVAIRDFQQVCLMPANNLAFNMHLPLRGATPARNFYLTRLEASDGL
jgi:hypothetical protein